MNHQRSYPINIVILGLENAGKTTLLRKLIGKGYTETTTTIGINVELIKYNEYTFQVIDVGGQLMFRNTLWPQYTKNALGVIFVFDMFDLTKEQEARKWFNEMQNWISDRAVIAFIANKMDLKETTNDFIPIEEIIKKFELTRFANYPMQSFRIFEVSAKTGENVEIAKEWFFKKIKENLKL